MTSQIFYLELAQNVKKYIYSIQKQVYSDMIQGKLFWLKKIIQIWHKSSSNIITTNYDLFIEQALETFIKICYKNAYKYPLLDPLTNKKIDTSLSKTLSIYKVHGSMNWLYSGKLYSYESPIYCDYTICDECNKENINKIEEIMFNRHLLMLPAPVYKNRFLNNKIIRDNWSSSRKIIHNSKNIYCIGFSFSKADKHLIDFLFNTNKISKKNIYIINLDKNVFNRCKNMLNSSYKIEFLYNDENPINSFINNY
ncbi:MAG: SIR2 family protein [Halobacteriovoraceae bacterium]|nr:SIR2 family protein [Halobacteriovoraceae bacterium]